LHWGSKDATDRPLHSLFLPGSVAIQYTEETKRTKILIVAYQGGGSGGSTWGVA